MKNEKHSHFPLWICVAICVVSIAILFFLVCIGGGDFVESGTRDLNRSESYYGVIATFIGICATIMLGSQIYSVYSSTQTEKEYDEKLDEIKKWFSDSSDQHALELEKLSKASHSFDKLKYLINNALAGLHYRDDKKFEGVIDVMENIYTLLNNPNLFEDNYREKLDFACYSIAKNLKEYADDLLFKKKNVIPLILIQQRWNKRFSQIDFGSESAKYIETKLYKLNKVINSLINDLANNHFQRLMSRDDWNTLCEIAPNEPA